VVHVFVIDNYDSFTYNLVQLLGELGAEVTVARNDEVDVADIAAARPTHLLVSPGPCTPAEAGVSLAAVLHFAGRVPVLGVCLGHQCIGAAFGGTVRRAAAVVHGKTDLVSHDGRTIFAGLPEPLTATRYHSLVVDPDLPSALELSAWNAAGEVMGLRHRTCAVEGVQFHPESVLTEAGAALLANFLGLGRGAGRAAATVAAQPDSPPPERTQRMPNEILSAALAALSAGRDLTEGEARAVLLEIMGGRVTEAQTAAYLSALRVKGETAEEIVGMARAMTELAEKVTVDADVILDTCGTGGDGAQTFNISTAAALIAAGAGATVAKHGNRSATSRCGSADVLEALGVAIDLSPAQVSRCIAEVGIGFMFAPRHHLAMKTVAPVRRELGMATTFNVIGPLTNPAGARHQLIGVADARYVDRLARAVRLMGSARNLLVHSDDGLDEISTTCPTAVVEVFAGQGFDRRYTITPEQFGLARAPSLAALRGGDAAENATLLRALLGGEPGRRLDVALLNAGAALYIAEQAASIDEGVGQARAAVASGAARDKLEALVTVTQRLRAEVA
jgi:anthranilate synthase/phosphoribosyltransferase